MALISHYDTFLINLRQKILYVIISNITTTRKIGGSIKRCPHRDSYFDQKYFARKIFANFQDSYFRIIKCAYLLKIHRIFPEELISTKSDHF